MTILNYSGKMQNRYPFDNDAGRVGLIERELLSNTYVNNADELPKIVTITLSTASGDQVTTIEGNEITTAFDTDDATTAAAIAANLAADETVLANYIVTVAAAVVTIESRWTGDNFVISHTGTGSTLAVSQAATESSKIPYGRVVAYKVTDPVDAVRLPSDAGDIVLGICGSDLMIEADVTGTVTYFERGELVPTLSQGLIWAEVEADVSRGDIPYYRRAVDGALDQLGILAPAAGTGLTQLAGAAFVSGSYVYDGVRIALVNINRP